MLHFPLTKLHFTTSQFLPVMDFFFLLCGLSPELFSLAQYIQTTTTTATKIITTIAIGIEVMGKSTA